jgi:hypothetical protein
MWLVKGSSVRRPTSTRSLIDSDGDTTPRLSSRLSHPPGLSFTISTQSLVHDRGTSFTMLNPSWPWWIHHQVLFLKTSHPTWSIIFCQNKTFCFSRARLSIRKKTFHKIGDQGKVINFPRKEMHQLFSTQLLSPNASSKWERFQNSKEVANAPGLSLCYRRVGLYSTDIKI